MAASESIPSRNHGFGPLGPGVLVKTAVRAVVFTVMMTKTEVFVIEGGRKVQVEADGNPLQVKLTVPAAAVAETPTWYFAGTPAATVTLGVLEKMDITGPISAVILGELLVRVASPPPETFTPTEETISGAFSATLNVTVTAG